MYLDNTDTDNCIMAQPALRNATGSNIAALGGRKRGWGKLGISDFQSIPDFYSNDQISDIFNNSTEFHFDIWILNVRIMVNS